MSTNHRPIDRRPAPPARRHPRPRRVEPDSTVAPTRPAPRPLYWDETGPLRAENPAADRLWVLATLAMLAVVTLAALGPLVAG